MCREELGGRLGSATAPGSTASPEGGTCVRSSSGRRREHGRPWTRSRQGWETALCVAAGVSHTGVFKRHRMSSLQIAALFRSLWIYCLQMSRRPSTSRTSLRGFTVVSHGPGSAQTTYWGLWLRAGVSDIRKVVRVRGHKLGQRGSWDLRRRVN